MKPFLNREINEKDHSKEAARRMIALAARCVADGSSVTKAVAMRHQGLTNRDFDEVGEAFTRALVATDVRGQCQNPLLVLSCLALDVAEVLSFQLDSHSDSERAEAVQAIADMLSTFTNTAQKALRVSASDQSPAVKVAGNSLRGAIAESLLSGGRS
jgi:hypothetical protein